MKYNVKKNIVAEAKRFSLILGKRAREFAPNHLRPAIHTKFQASESGGKIFMLLYTDEPRGRKFGDIYGREYGAGLYGARREKYKIFPKMKKVLMFEWEKADMGAIRAHINKRLWGSKYKAQSVNYPRLNEKIYGIPGDSKNFSMIVPSGKRVMFNYVEHPGYPPENAGEGFLNPAVNQTLLEIDESWARGKISYNLWKAVQQQVEDIFHYKVGKNPMFKIYNLAIGEGYSELKIPLGAHKKGYGGKRY